MAFPSLLTMEPNRKTNKQIKTPTLMETDKEASGMVSSREELIDGKKERERGREGGRKGERKNIN